MNYSNWTLASVLLNPPQGSIFPGWANARVPSLSAQHCLSLDLGLVHCAVISSFWLENIHELAAPFAVRSIQPCLAGVGVGILTLPCSVSRGNTENHQCPAFALWQAPSAQIFLTFTCSCLFHKNSLAVISSNPTMTLLSYLVSSFITITYNSTPKPSPWGYMNTEVKYRHMLICSQKESLMLDHCPSREAHINPPTLVCMCNPKPNCLSKALCFD